MEDLKQHRHALPSADDFTWTNVHLASIILHCHGFILSQLVQMQRYKLFGSIIGMNKESRYPNQIEIYGLCGPFRPTELTSLVSKISIGLMQLYQSIQNPDITRPLRHRWTSHQALPFKLVHVRGPHTGRWSFTLCGFTRI